MVKYTDVIIFFSCSFYKYWFVYFIFNCESFNGRYGIYAVGCSVHLVELKDSGGLYAMKAMDKTVMLNRNKV